MSAADMLTVTALDEAIHLAAARVEPSSSEMLSSSVSDPLSSTPAFPVILFCWV